MSSLSVVISAYNEEKRLASCLNSVSFADEIIVIDNSSTDATATVAASFTKHVYSRENNLMLNINKNFGFTKTHSQWILSLDADEQVPQELQDEILQRIHQENDCNGYWIPRKNIIFGKWIQNSIWWPDYQLRLFRKGYGKFPEKHVHEMLTVEGKTDKLQQPMLHDNYSSISQYIYKLDKIYTENEVENFISQGKDISWFDAIRFPMNDFLKTFFAQKGYRDGLHGLVLSLLQAFYAEIVFAKIWEKKGFTQYENKQFLEQFFSEAKNAAYEIQYWYLTERILGLKNPIQKLSSKLTKKSIQNKIKKYPL